MKHKTIILLFILSFLPLSMMAQTYQRQDSLRGHITKERGWWDLLHYKIDLSVDIEKKTISGKNIISYKVIQPHTTLQIDLQDPMEILSISQNGEPLKYRKEFTAYFIELTEPQPKGSVQEISIKFRGIPPESKNPPWDGGFVWRKDKNNNPFVANANQLLGSSSWLPSKDIPYDEPNHGMEIRIKAPAKLMSVSNGRLLDVKQHHGGSSTYHWKVINPINGYGINMNIGDYAHFGEIYQGEKGPLDLDYYVLKYNLEKAKTQFLQVPKMLEAFEYWFGPYPFYEDGFKIVETPYLGMEHQSSVTYGNGYQNGYLGGDLSGTGAGLNFDFIIIHESGHEWFANNITNFDAADMWIHESFTTYSEVLYLDYHFGTETGNTYLKGYRSKVANDSPIIGVYEVNQRGSGDMYIKGAAMIHTLRQVINDDKKFRALLRNINSTFYHQTVSSEQIENYIMEQTGLELTGFFNQYLRTTEIPTLQYKIKNGTLKYRFKNTVDEFQIPVKFNIDEKEVWLQPTDKWQNHKLGNQMAKISIDDNFYIDLKAK